MSIAVGLSLLALVGTVQQNARAAADSICAAAKAGARITEVAARPPRATSWSASTVELGYEVRIKFDNYATVDAIRTCARLTNPSSEYVLFVDERPVSMALQARQTDPARGEMVFRFRPATRATDSAVWNEILGRPGFKPRPARMSVGLNDRYPLDTGAVLQVRVLPVGWFWFWASVFALIVGGWVYLIQKTNVLRDPGRDSASGLGRPFSLTRIQASVWFLIVVGSYLFIGMITGDFTSISGTVLVLLGISTGTTVASVMVDARRDAAVQDAEDVAARAAITGSLQAVNARLATADSALKANPRDPVASANKAKDLKMQETLKAQLGRLNNQSEGFWRDILSDADGVSLHRFQMVAWTVILGAVFIISVYHRLTMPTFDATLLGLMGISATAFVSMKAGEATVPKVPRP